MNLRVTLTVLSVLPLARVVAADDLRLGIIGLDTSHVVAFTKILNDPQDPNHVPGAKVTVAFKGGSPDIESSASRVDGYTQELRDRLHVRLADSIGGPCRQVDAVMV